MSDWRWVSVGFGTAAIAWLCASASSPMPAVPLVADSSFGPGVEAMETRVGLDPGDADALSRLADAYLAHNAPGLAEAALDRAPEAVRELPPIADARARALSELGSSRQALAAQEEVLRSCASQECPPALEGRAAYRAGYLVELVRLGVEDPRAQPQLALLAYRRSSREVALDVR